MVKDTKKNMAKVVAGKKVAAGRIAIIKNKNQKTNVLGIVLLSLLFLVLLIFAAIAYSAIAFKSHMLGVMELNATINVSDYVGFNLDKDKLHFGTVFPGGYAVRELTLTSEKEGFVYITVDEEFEDWVYVSAQNDRIGKDYYLPLKIKTKVPPSVSSGDYEFKIYVFITEKRVNCISKWFLKGDLARLDGTEEPEGSAKVGIEIVNSSRK